MPIIKMMNNVLESNDEDDAYIERAQPLPPKNTTSSTTLWVSGLSLALCMCLAILVHTAYTIPDNSAPRLQLALGNKTCGNADNYVTPYAYGIEQCRLQTKLPDIEIVRMELIVRELPETCRLCLSTEKSCVPRHCIPRHLAHSYDSIAILSAMAGAWCAKMKMPDKLDEALNLTCHAARIGVWQHSLRLTDASASLLLMAPNMSNTTHVFSSKMVCSSEEQTVCHL